MATKHTPSAPAPLELRVPRTDAEAKLVDRAAKGQVLVAAPIDSWEALELAEQAYSKWSSYNAELLRRLFTNESLAEEYSAFGMGFVTDVNESLGKRVSAHRDDIQKQIHRLDSIRGRLELYPEPVASVVSNQSSRAKSGPPGRRVFVVHGHDEAARESVARYVERLGFEAVVLHEQANEGRTIVEKLEHYSDVDFAVVLLTPDDVGATASSHEQLRSRARQNVILELGFFVGKLGRKRVCALHKSSIELPSDMMGVVYVHLDEAAGWRLLLAKELRAAGFDIDMNLAV